jgi:hypothetical protein
MTPCSPRKASMNSGAWLDELMTATGWQKHSVGFLSGTIKKKLGLAIKRDGTTYRIMS